MSIKASNSKASSKKNNGTNSGIKPISRNKKAGRDYEIISRHECGIELRGTEVKSIRAGKVNISDAFARVERGQVFLYGCHIQPWDTASTWYQHETSRSRRLLMHKREILKLDIQMAQKGYTLPLLRLYWKDGKVKAEIGLGRGKTHQDQRYALKERVEMREAQREVIRFNKGR